VNRFHAHLDICEQCREHPLNLCEVGAYFLGKAVDAGEEVPKQSSNECPECVRAPSKPVSFVTGRLMGREPRMQTIPIRTELGKQIREIFTGPPGSSMVMGDYNAIEMRLMAQFSKEFEDKTEKKPLVCAECGCETNTSMGKPCSACGSARVVLVSVIEDTFGENWRDAFKDHKK
jgi:hypothetical protein